MEKYERKYLVDFVRANHVEYVFEVGTRHGLTAKSLSPHVKHVYTLDIKNENVSSGNISFLVGDSRFFDFKPFFDRMDLVFIDGNHNVGFVRRDSRNAVLMCRNGGYVFWHDYCLSHLDIVRFVNRFCKNNGFKFGDVAGTKLVYCVVKKG